MSAGPVPRPPSRVLRLLLVALSSLGVLAFSQFALSQQATEKPQNIPLPRPSGMSTGGIHAPIKDSHSRPITAGGFVDDAPVVFVDITHQAGLDKFHHRSGSPETSPISTTTTMAGSTFISLTDRPLPPQKAQSPRPAPCSSTTITTAPSPTSPTKPACPMIAGVSAWPSGTTTT